MKKRILEIIVIIVIIAFIGVSLFYSDSAVEKQREPLDALSSPLKQDSKEMAEDFKQQLKKIPKEDLAEFISDLR